MTPTSPRTALVSASKICILCGCRLTTQYAIDRGLCGSCSDRPEAKRLPRDGNGKVVPPATRPQTGAPAPKQPRAFTAADKSLIRAMHPYLPAAELVRILNDRLHADVGAAAPSYTLEQLQAELRELAAAAPASDWAGLRQLLAEARRSGVLATITPQTIDDFAICFQLTAAQKLHLHDVIRHAKEDGRT